MSNKNIQNVVIYTRVSTIKQTHGFSLEDQRVEIENYCKVKEYNIIERFEDAGATGTSIEKRPQFKALLRAAIKKPNIDAVVIWKLSRISRNMVDLVGILELLDKYDVGIVSVTDGINTYTAGGRSFIYMAGIFAEMERDNIVQQAKNGMKQRARQGKWNGGPLPIGYDNGGKKLVINESEACTVKLIFHLYTDLDWGYSRICKYLNMHLDQHATKNGNSWSYATVKQILDNPTYAGYIRWGKHQDWRKNRRKGVTSDYILAEGEHEAIIDQSMWQRTRAKGSARERNPKS